MRPGERRASFREPVRILPTLQPAPDDADEKQADRGGAERQA